MRIILPDKNIVSFSEGPVEIGSLLHRLGLHPPEFIVMMNGKLVPEDAVAGIDDEIRIIRVAHGG